MAKTAEEYAAELGAAQLAYQKAKAAGQNTKEFEAQGKTIRSQATAGGMDLSKLGATNKFGQDYTSFVKPVDTGIVATDTTPTNTPSNTPSNYIESINNAKQQAIFSQLDKSKNAALSGLAEERAGVAPRYYESRNQVAAGSQRSAASLAEFMSQRGGVRSGANAQAEISRMGTLQGNLGNLNRQEQQTYDGLDRRTSDLNSAYQSDRASAVAGNEADRMSALLGQFNSDRQYNLELGGQLGSINGQQTLGAQSLGLQKQGQSFDQNMQNKQFDYGVGRDSVLDNRYDQQLERSNFESDRSYDFAVGQQEFENLFKQEQFDFNKAETLWNQQFQNKSFNQSVKESAQQLGLNYTRMSQDEQRFATEMAYKKEQFNYTKEQDKISNDLAASKVNQPEPLSDSQTKNNTFADYTSSLDTLDADELRAAFTQEKSNIIKELGPSGYNSLYSMYFDSNGNPK